ncbi:MULTISPECIES: DEAD/DEAH box helicase [unclassified Delftia]|uniref:DEAD/DEAH box helicase n=1 Tax=unclassified Delftia TaxID=2613839 RepID=UPI00190298DA|nr:MULTISPECIES: DEAD/DEAH box helicase family protein [unclassified Delftia]MBK0116113.1 DEAD/DEAH box helicase family protein [Delftia sp. S65]MBK0121978.1 DEAD/DEAH box helicase family protein [Delftia sp. S67]MBK0132586.1 DEAD/DEAH box helicase family protein [Delftia sp. S66]
MVSKPGSANLRSIQTLDHLQVSAKGKTTGGVVKLKVPLTADRAKVAQEYEKAMVALDDHEFWFEGAEDSYRSDRGLWTPQRRAVALAHAYLASRKHAASDAPREAALIKMPTGTGKTGVIATLACVSPLVKKVLILTPRAGLVHQMKQDLSFRFWSRSVQGVYHGCKLHEKLTDTEIGNLTAAIKAGKVSPVRVLAAEEYAKIWKERTQDRQILVSTFNALHLVLGIAPPPHRSMYGKEIRPVASSLNGLEPGKTADECVAAFQDLLKSVDLVIVDEGHHEPAYSWALAVRAIGKPTIIFSATPYRNDYKYFEVDGNFVFNLPWQEAVYQKLIRDVQFAAPVASISPKSSSGSGRRSSAAKPTGYTPQSFVDEFAATLKLLPAGKKVIVHAGTFAVLKALQRVFFNKGKGEVALLIHDAYQGTAELECKDLDGLSARHKQQLKELRFNQVRQTQANLDVSGVRIWLHQFKLMEGIDDSSFIEIWLYDGLGNARQVVQQIGRAIRRRDLSDPTGQIAIIRGSSKKLDRYEGSPTVAEQTARRWKEYLAYEEYAAQQPDLAFIAETQLVASVKRTAPAVQYIAGEFKGGHLLDQNPTMAAFVLPRRAVVCRVEGVDSHDPKAIPDKVLDQLQAASCEAMQLEERFDIAVVSAPAGDIYKDVRLIRYLAWGNSPYLASHHIPEWRLGVMAIVRSGRYIFLIDTESICIDYERLKLLSPEPVELKRLFAGTATGTAAPANATRIIETVASGLDTSELGLRSISVRKHALEDTYFDLAESSQIPTSVRGFGQLGPKSARRRLSLSRSSVADATNKLLPVKDYVEWTRIVGTTMADDGVKPHGFFDRFANEVAALDETKGVPKSILLDVWELLDTATETRDERAWDLDAVREVLEWDTCCDISDRRTSSTAPARYAFDFGPHEVEIKYIYKAAIPSTGRYALSCPALNEAISDPSARAGSMDNTAVGRLQSLSLTQLINQEQSFRVITSQDRVVYSKSHFYRPHIDDALMSILEPCKAVDLVVSEKGDTRITSVADWDSKTLFGLVYGWINSTTVHTSELAKDLQGCGLVICDDRNDETADFYGINDVARRVFMVHGKAADGTAGVSARKLQDVTRQALASLAFAGSSRRDFPFSSKWKSDWQVVLQAAQNTVISKTRFLSKVVKPLTQPTPKEAHGLLLKALADPTYKKEIVMFTGGLLSRKAALATLKSSDQRELQFLYFLAAVRSTFDRAGVRLRIVCNE